MLKKEDLNNVRIISNIKVIKKLSKVLIKVCDKIDIDYNIFLEILGFKKNDEFDSDYMKKSELWGSLSVTEKETVLRWVDISTEQKRDIVKEVVGVLTDDKIDEEVKKYNQLSDYFEQMDFEKLEKCSKYLKERDINFSKGVIVGKLTSLFLNEYDDENDTYGELYTSFCQVLHIATNNTIEVETLLDSPLELLLEIVIRLVAKTENEVEESFFINKLVKSLMKFTNISSIMNKEI